jgi:hypothetical protein
MGWTYSTTRTMRNAYKILVAKYEENEEGRIRTRM